MLTGDGVGGAACGSPSARWSAAISSSVGSCTGLPGDCGEATESVGGGCNASLLLELAAGFVADFARFVGGLCASRQALFVQ